MLEAGTGGTLIEAIANSGGRLGEEVAACRVVGPLLRALAHLHGCGIVHRDVKPEHVLLMPDGLRLADFSVAARLPYAPAAPAALHEDVRKRSVELRRSIEALHARHSRGGSACGLPEISADDHQGAHGKEGGGPSAAVAADASSSGVKDVLNHRAGSIEYMAPEMLSKPTAAEVFHLVSEGAGQQLGPCQQHAHRSSARLPLQPSRRLQLQPHVSGNGSLTPGWEAAPCRRPPAWQPLTQALDSPAPQPKFSPR